MSDNSSTTQGNKEKRDWILRAINALNLKTVANGATEGEAAAAAAKVVELMQKYDIAQAEVVRQGGQADANPFVIRVVYQSSDKHPERKSTRGEQWKMTIGYAVAKSMDVETLQVGETGLRFIGYERDVEMAIYLYEQLVNRIAQLAKQRVKQYTDSLGVSNKNTLTGTDHPLVYRASYLEGAANAVYHRMMDQHKVHADSEQGRALVIAKAANVRQYAIEQYPSAYGYLRFEGRLMKYSEYWDLMEQRHPTPKTAVSTTSSSSSITPARKGRRVSYRMPKPKPERLHNYEAYERGQTDGRKMDIRKGIED